MFFGRGQKCFSPPPQYPPFPQCWDVFWSRSSRYSVFVECWRGGSSEIRGKGVFGKKTSPGWPGTAQGADCGNGGDNHAICDGSLASGWFVPRQALFTHGNRRKPWDSAQGSHPAGRRSSPKAPWTRPHWCLLAPLARACWLTGLPGCKEWTRGLQCFYLVYLHCLSQWDKGGKMEKK